MNNIYLRRGNSNSLLLILLIISFSLFNTNAFSQTVLINPATDGGFETSPGNFAANGWFGVNGSLSWYTATANLTNGSYTFARTGNHAIYISSSATANNWAGGSGTTTASTAHFYKDVTFPAGNNLNPLSFRWCAGGELTYDELLVYICPTTLLPVSGNPSGTSTSPTTWTGSGTATLLGRFSLGATAGQTSIINIPQSAIGNVSSSANMRIVFTWKNDGSVGTAPGLAIDDISLTSASCATNPLTGTVTVGPGGTYTTLTAALNDINARGVSGNVFVELNSTYTSAGETFPLVLSSNLCMSSSNTVTIRPAAGATGRSITSSNTTATFSINGGNFWTIDGRPGGSGARDLAIGNTGGAPAVLFINEASNNTVRFCTVTSTVTSTVSGLILFSTTTGTNGNDNNTIDNCDLNGGGTAGNIIYSSGTTTSTPHNNSGNTISNNLIRDFFIGASADWGINIQSGNTDWTISGNSIYQTATRNQSSANTEGGININNTGNNYVVSGNFIGGSAANCGGTAWTIGGSIANRFRGISMSVGTTTASSVQGNTIANFNFTSNSSATGNGGPWTGIYLTGGNANIGTVTGNTIGSGTGNGSIVLSVITNSGGRSSGIFCDAASTVTNISNNVIGSITMNASTISHGFVGIATTAGTTLTINNNTIGSTVTSNSINVNTGATSTTAQVVTGILNTSAATIAITNNTIANILNNYAPSSANTSNVLAGINSSSGINTITGNTIRNLSTTANATGTSSNASVVGISSTSANASTVLSQNTIHTLSNTNSGSTAIGVIGIHYNGPTTGTNRIARNLIYGLTTGATSVSGFNYGINVTGGLANFQNNMISIGSGNNGIDVRGINDVTGTNNYYFNSVYIGGAPTANAANTFAFSSAVTVNVRNFQNNIFVNARSNSGSTGKHYGISVGGTGVNPTGLTSNYNIVRANGTGGVFGLYGAVDRPTLTDWQTATGQDANSFNTDPQFVSPASATPDLHINANVFSNANGTGLAIAGITDDYDGQTRAGLSPTDIGADAYDAIISCATYTSPADGAINQLVTGVNLTWSAATNATSYDVYFGTDNPPTNIANGVNQAGLTYSTGALSSSTTYYWRIVPRNAFGAATCNTIWSFQSTGSAPVLNTTPTSLAFGNQCQNTTSTALTFSMEALNLTGTTVTITAPTDFEVSEDGIAYAPSITVAHSSGAFTAKIIYVRFTPTTLGPYSGNVVISDGGLPANVNVAVTGTGGANLAGLTYLSSSPVYCTNSAITANTASLSATSGTVVYSVSPGLPTGLVFNTSTGAITGTPTTTLAATPYTVTASNGCSNTTTVVTISVIQNMSGLTYTSASMTVCQNTAATTNNVATVTGGGTISYSINPALPAGLSINTSTGAISGTPTVAAAVQTYTVTASNGCSQATATVSITVQAALSGTYTVGAGGNYTTLTAAVAAYNSSCLNGPVIFSLTNATYNAAGGETFPITINANSSANATNTLTIRPAASVTATITGSFAGQLIRFSGADFVTIDGSNSGGTDKSLTITNTSTATPAGIWISSAGTGLGATNNTVRNCIINVNSSLSAAATGISISGSTINSTGADNDNVTIQNNTINSPGFGIYANGTAAGSTGGIDNLIISGNSIATGSSSATVIGVDVANALNALVSSNTFNLTTSSGTSPVAISIEAGVSGSSIVANQILAVVTTSTSGYGGRGITVGTGSASSNITIANNFIAGVNGSNYSSFSNSSSAGIMIGVVGGSSTLTTIAGGLNIYHNTINMSGSMGTGSTTALTAAMYVGSGASALDIRNNIFVNTMTGTSSTQKNYAIYSAAANTAFSNMNFNNYFVSNSFNAASAILGFIASGDRTTVSAFNSAFGGNANSLNVAPVFTSSTDLHLIPSSNLALNDLGTPLAAVTTDIDGTTRSSTPDMGADEFTPPICTTAVAGTATGTTTFCGQGTPTITASGYSVIFGISYEWESSSDIGFTSPVVVGTNPAALSTGLVTTTTYYRLKVLCSNGSITDYSNIITVTVNPVPTASASSNSPICAGNTLNLFSGATGGTSYAWTGPNTFGSSDENPSITNATTAASGGYTVTVTNASGCTASSSTPVTVNPLPVITSVSATPSTVCNGNSATLIANTISTSTVGTDNSTTKISTAGTPYRTGTTVNNQVRSQYLILASELTSAGFSSGNLNSLGFTVTTASPTGNINNLTIRMAHTAVAAMTTTYLTPTFTTVFTTPSYTPVNGLNNHTFTTPFFWNGTSNIVIDVCGTSTISGSGTTLATFVTPVQTTVADASATSCSSTAGVFPNATTFMRPVFTINGNAPGTTTFQWSPGVIPPGLTAIVTPTTNTDYTVLATTTSNCTASASVSVIVAPVPSTPTIVSNPDVCGYGVPGVVVSSSGGMMRWYTVSTGGTPISGESGTTLTSYVVSSSTTLYVSEFDGTCEGARLAVPINVIGAPAITPSSPMFGCTNQNLQLTVSSPNTGYVYTWSSSSSGSGLTGTVIDDTLNIVPTTSGSKVYTVEANDGVCRNNATVTVTVVTTPVISSATALPSAVCPGTTVNLSASSLIPNSTTATIGTGTSTLSTTGNPYRSGNGVGNQIRTQLLVTASELTSAGLTAGNLTSLGFTTTAASTGTLSNFSISIGHTTATALTTAMLATSTTQVFTASTFTPLSAGLNVHTFSTPFLWDGNSNILINICQTNSISGTSNVFASTPAFVANNQAAGATTSCTATSGTTSTLRPNMVINGTGLTNNTGAYNWVWNPGAISGSSASVVPTASTIYTVTATDGTSGCSASATASVTYVTSGATPVASASPTIICSSGTTTLTVTNPDPALTYTWQGATSSTGPWSNLGTGSPFTTNTLTNSAWFRVVSSCGATTDSSAAVQVDVLTPQITSLSPATRCGYGQVTLSVTGTGTIDWYETSTSTTPLATNTLTYSPFVSATTNFFVVSTVGGCTNPGGRQQITATVVAAPTVTATASPATICSGQSSTLQASSTNTGYTYNWTTNGTTVIGTGANFVVSPTTTTTYTVNAIDNSGGLNNNCGFQTSVQVTVNPTPATPTISPATSSICTVGGSQILTASSSSTIPYSFNESFNAAGTPAGWTLTALNTNIVVSVQNLSNAGGSPRELRFDATTASTSDNGTSFARLPMINASNISGLSISFKHKLDNFSATTYPYTIRVQTSTNNTTWTDAWSFTPTGSTVYTATTATASLSALNGSATAYVRFAVIGNHYGMDFWHIDDVSITGQSNGNWSWSPNTASTATVTVSPTTTTVYTATLTSPSGCTATATATVNYTPVSTPTITASGPTTYCAPGSVTLDAGSGYGSYSWSDGTSVVGNLQTLNVSPSATTTYTVTVANGACSATASQTVTVNTIVTPTITSSGGTSFCAGGSTTLSVPATYASYLWSTTETTNSISVSASGTYTVQVTDANGCTATASTGITVNPIPTIFVTPSDTVEACDDCTPVTLTASASAGASIAWNDENSTTDSTLTIDACSSTDLVFNAGTFQYVAVATGTGGCSASASVVVTTINCSTGITLNANMFIEGFYQNFGAPEPMDNYGMGGCLFVTGASLDPTDADYLTISLMDTTPPHAQIEAVVCTLKTNGTVIANFTTSPGTYYIKVSHRNSIDVWSASPVTLAAISTYDFTSALATYGDNMLEVEPGVFAMFSGDIADASLGLGFKDGIVESSDYAEMENAVYVTLTGYTVEDITGDGIVESLDYAIMENNLYFTRFVLQP